MQIARLSTTANAPPERLILICVVAIGRRLVRTWMAGSATRRMVRLVVRPKDGSLPMKNWITAAVVLAMALAMYSAIIYKMS